jgi:hypothetical protein
VKGRRRASRDEQQLLLHLGVPPGATAKAEAVLEVLVTLTGHNQNVVDILVHPVYRGLGHWHYRERHMQRRGGHRLRDGPSHRGYVYEGQTAARQEQQSEAEVRRGIEKRAGFVVSDSYMRVSC